MAQRIRAQTERKPWHNMYLHPSQNLISKSPCHLDTHLQDITNRTRQKAIAYHLALPPYLGHGWAPKSLERPGVAVVNMLSMYRTRSSGKVNTT